VGALRARWPVRRQGHPARAFLPLLLLQYLTLPSLICFECHIACGCITYLLASMSPRTSYPGVSMDLKSDEGCHARLAHSCRFRDMLLLLIVFLTVCTVAAMPQAHTLIPFSLRSTAQATQRTSLS